MYFVCKLDPIELGLLYVLSVCLSICVSVCLPLSISFFLSLSLHVCPSISLTLSDFLSVCVCVCVCVLSLSVCLSVTSCLEVFFIELFKYIVYNCITIISPNSISWSIVLLIWYNSFLVYCRELAPGTVSLTGNRAQGDDSKHDSHYSCVVSIQYKYNTIQTLVQNSKHFLMLYLFNLWECCSTLR